MPIISTFPSGSGGGSLKVQSISITTPPTKTAYYVGDTFDKTGMVVKASYGYGIEEEITNYNFSPSGALTINDTVITISFTVGNTTVTATQAITVTKETLAVPTLASTDLTYTGSEQTPTWDGYNSAKMSISGDTSGTDADTYSATFSLVDTDKYQWTDGSTADQTVSWTIAQAEGSITVDPTEITLDMDNPTGTINVTSVLGDGSITAESSNTNVATVSASADGKTFTVNNVDQANGSATITISAAASKNYKAASATVDVTATFISTVLEENSWNVIKSVSEAGEVYNWWADGDTKSITINGTVGAYSISDLAVDTFILEANHNSAKEGTNLTHFQIGKINNVAVALCDSGYNSNYTNGTKYFNMNHWGNYNYGGWASCDMRYDVLGSTNKAPTGYGSAKTTSLTTASATDAPDDTATNPVANTLMAALPSDLRAVMKPVTKYTDNNGNSSNSSANVTGTKDYLFLLSEYEVQGARSYANTYEQNYQTQYAYYKSGNPKIAYNHSATGTAVWWWLRSAYFNYYGNFCFVTTSGSANYSGAYYAGGLRPGFCV